MALDIAIGDPAGDDCAKHEHTSVRSESDPTP
jgi:hypothetical protein